MTLDTEETLRTTQILPVILHPQMLENKDKTHQRYRDSQDLGKAPSGGPADRSSASAHSPALSLSARHLHRPQTSAEGQGGRHAQQVRVARWKGPSSGGTLAVLRLHAISRARTRAPQARAGLRQEGDGSAVLPKQRPSAGSAGRPSCQTNRFPAGSRKHRTPRRGATRHTHGRPDRGAEPEPGPGPSVTGKTTKPSDVQTPDFRSARSRPGLVRRRRLTAGWGLGPGGQNPALRPASPSLGM